MNTSPTTFYLDISGKDGVTNVGSKYTFTSEKCPIEYKNNTENILNIASDNIDDNNTFRQASYFYWRYNILYRINKIKSSIEIMLDFFIFYKKLML